VSGYVDLVRLLDDRRARALVRAARADSTGLGGVAGDADPEFVALAERPFASVDDVHARLHDLEARLRAAGDRRAVFLTVYTRMTATVRDAVDDGRFADPAWMRRYTVTFADHYRRAFLAFERGDLRSVPDPWRVAFGTAAAGDALVVQDAFLGISAHVNYDLALTLRDVGVDPDRGRKHADHRRVDDVLAGLVDAQQAALAALYAPGIEDLDASIGRLDERLSLLSMTEGRAWAWRVATVLTDVDWAPARRYVRWLLRGTATGAAWVVRSPSLDPALVAALARAERDRGSLDERLALLGARLDAR
jgi:hypothetical protein